MTELHLVASSSCHPHSSAGSTSRAAHVFPIEKASAQLLSQPRRGVNIGRVGQHRLMAQGWGHFRV